MARTRTRERQAAGLVAATAVRRSPGPSPRRSDSANESGIRGVVERWQRNAGNHALAEAMAGGGGGGPVVARLRDHATWMKDSDIAIGPFRTKRSTELQAVDQAVADLDAAGADNDLKKQRLVAIEVAINAWKSAKGGPQKAEKKARGPHIKSLFDEVQTEKGRVDAAIKKSKITAMDANLLAGIPTDTGAAAAMLFDRFMTHFRGKVGYTLTTAAGKNPWDGGAGPYACGTFAKALADYAIAAGIPAKAVMVSARNFVTPEVDGDFIDTGAEGNVQDHAGKRQARYFFTEHWVTEIAGQYFCPTSGKPLSGLAAPELVDGTIGQLKPGAPGEYTGNGFTVRKVGVTAKGGGLYQISRS